MKRTKNLMTSGKRIQIHSSLKKEKCPASMIIRDMQIKIKSILRYNFLLYHLEKIGQLMTHCIAEHVGKQILSYAAGESIIWYDPYGIHHSFIYQDINVYTF